MKPIDFAIAALLLFLLALEGCILGPIAASQLSKDQLDALKNYNDTGDVYACFLAGGPPPSGGLVAIIVPKDVPVDLQFGPDCHAVVKTAK